MQSVKRKHNVFKRKSKGLVNQDKTVDFLTDSERLSEYSEYKHITKKVRGNIIVSHDTLNSNGLNNSIRKHLSLENEEMLEHLSSFALKFKSLFERKYNQILITYMKESFKPRVLPTPLQIKTEFFDKDDLKIFFMDADYDVDRINGELCVNIYGLSDDDWNVNASKEQKEQKSYNCPMMARVWGFEPYFYIEKHKSWDYDLINNLIEVLDITLIEKYPFSSKEIDDFTNTWGSGNWVNRFEIEKCGEFMGYHGNETKQFVKIFVKHPKMVVALRNILDFPKGRVLNKHRFYSRFNDDANSSDDDDADDDNISDYKKESETIGLRTIFQENYPEEILEFNFLPTHRDLKYMTDEQEKLLINDSKHIYFPKIDLGFLKENLKDNLHSNGHLESSSSSNNNSNSEKSSIEFRIFEADVAFVIRYIADNLFRPAAWLTVKKGNYRAVTEESKKNSKTPIEFIIPDYRDLVEIKDEEIQKNIPNFIKLSFDDEMSTPEGRFPRPDKDPIIAKGVSVNVDRNRSDIQNYVFSLEDISYTKPHNFIHFPFKKEEDMILEWIRFLKTIDFDIITHYNGNCFDWKYNIERCKKLGIPDIKFLTRHKYRSVYRTERKNRGLTKGVFKGIGYLNVDMLRIIQTEKKYPDNTLGYASQDILGQTKEDFDVHLIDTLQKTPRGREKLAVYVIKDSILPLKMFDKMNISTVQIARLARIPMQDCFDKAQNAKITGKLIQEALDVDGTRMLKINLRKQPEIEKYTAAAVLKPKSAFYDGYVLVQDFKSLYPSIIMHHNYCFTTYVDNETIDRLGLIEGEDNDYVRLPNYYLPLEGYDEDEIRTLPDPDRKMPAFVTRRVREGILPRVEKELGESRDVIKALMKKEIPDSFQHNSYDGEQLAAKGWMNSIYGVTADKTSAYRLVAIALAITLMGRHMLHSIRIETKHYFNRRIVAWDKDIKNYGRQVKEAFPFDSNVVYGDSIMVHLSGIDSEYTSGEYADKIGYRIQSHMNDTLFKGSPSIYLQYEKKYVYYNLVKKKNYAGYLLGPGKQIGDKYTGLDVKGQKFKKRGPSAFERDLGKNCCEMISIEGNIEGAWNYAMTRLVKLLKRQITMGTLIKTQQFSKDLKRYGHKIEKDKVTGKKTKVITAIGPAVSLALRLARDIGYQEAISNQSSKSKERLEKINPEEHIKYDLYPMGSIVNFVVVERDWQKTRKNPGLSANENKHTELKIGDQAEEPFKAIRDDIPYDVSYYLDQSLKMLWKLFAGPFGEVYVEDKPSLRKISKFWERIKNEPRLNEITRKKQIQKTSPLFRHLVELPKCLICKSNITKSLLEEEEEDDSIRLCKECLPFKDFHQVKAYNNLKYAYNTREKVYDTCKMCLHTDDIEDIESCTSKSCPNFIMRKETTSQVHSLYKSVCKLGCMKDSIEM